MFKVFTLSMLAILSLTSLAIGEIYRWEDSSGKVHFDTVAPKTSDARNITVNGVAPSGVRAPEKPDDGSRRIVGTGNVGCTDRDDYKKLLGYVAQNDRQAFARALVEYTGDGRCRMMHVGDLVFITDTAIFSGMVQVRMKGELAEYWTDVKAVSTK